MKEFKKSHSTLIGVLTVLIVIAVAAKACCCVRKKLCRIDEMKEE